MIKIFIAHAWSGDNKYNQEQLEFIRLLQIEFEDRSLEVVFDDGKITKGTLNRFMVDNIKESDVILPICDEVYFSKSEESESGVTFEINQITEHNFWNKVIPIRIGTSELPYEFGTSEYVYFNGLQITEDSDSLRKLFIRIADLLKDEQLYPTDIIKDDVLSEINSLGIISGILNDRSLTLSDIYTYPDLRLESEKDIEYLSVKKYLSDKKYLGRTIFVGDRQSGKSSLSKKLFLDLYHAGLQPIFLEKGDFTSRNTEKIIRQKYIKTYLTAHKNNKENIIILVDDYHVLDSKNQDDIKKISDYAGIIVFVDDIFDISFSKNFFFERYVIQPMKPTLRNDLIERLISAQQIPFANENDRLKKIDESSELINVSLGLNKGYKNGIVPAFPLYILTILGATTDVRNKLDSPITSHGYCYQLLISLTFQNCGIKNDTIDSYINFLTCLASYIYHHKKKELLEEEFDEFLKEYKAEYHIYDEENYLKTLFQTGLIKKSNFLYYFFSYDYIYYFFLGKYFSENFEEELENIENIIKHLDFEENGNICIFIAHHSKNPKLIEMLKDNLFSIFYEYPPANLDKKELREFDKDVSELLSSVELKIGNYREERAKYLKKQDDLENEIETDYENGQADVEISESDRQSEVRRVIQTVEVIGVILKNRHGSIKKSDYEILLQGAVDANLRLLSSFVKIISDKEFIKFFEEYIFESIEDQNGLIEKPEFREKIRQMLMTMNFATIYNIIMKTIDSIGSEVVSQYFSELEVSNSSIPSYALINRGLELKYRKRFSKKEILSELKYANTSHIAQSIMKFMVFDHVSKHHYSFHEKSKIESEFGFKPKAIFKREQQLKLIDE